MALSKVEVIWKQLFPLSTLMSDRTAEDLGLPHMQGVCVAGWWAGECDEQLILLKRLSHGWAAQFVCNCGLDPASCWVVVDPVTWQRYLEYCYRIVTSEYREAGLIFDPPGFNPF